MFLPDNALSTLLGVLSVEWCSYRLDPVYDGGMMKLFLFSGEVPPTSILSVRARWCQFLAALTPLPHV